MKRYALLAIIAVILLAVEPATIRLCDQRFAVEATDCFVKQMQVWESEIRWKLLRLKHKLEETEPSQR